MKNVSLKVKLTMLYTFFMLLIICAVLALLLSLSSREVLSASKTKLRERVNNSTEDIVLRDGELKIKSDFYSVSGDIYLSLYDTSHYFLYGKIPYGFNTDLDFADGELRTVSEEGKDWYVYDLSFRLEEGYVVYIRGITSGTDAEAGFAVTVRFALILFPSLAALMALVGYRMTRRTLLPVKSMTETVQRICEDGDLSRRVVGKEKASGQKKHTGDEIAVLAQTFDGMLERLEKTFEREKQFTSDVSHELRTPVSVILAQCGVCLSDTEFKGRQREQIGLIQKKAEEMSETISGLLFLSRADQGRQTLRKEWLNVSELTLMTVEEEQFLADESGKKVQISCEIKPNLYADVDETFYIRMLSNLISNAVVYGSKEGQVTVSLRQESGQLIGSVEDNGPGIRKEDLPHVWERFYRADASRQGNHSGLGLPMVKWIAEAHGGTVRVNSEYGRGCKFSFIFPVKNKNL